MDKIGRRHVTSKPNGTDEVCAMGLNTEERGASLPPPLKLDVSFVSALGVRAFLAPGCRVCHPGVVEMRCIYPIQFGLFTCALVRVMPQSRKCHCRPITRLQICFDLVAFWSPWDEYIRSAVGSADFRKTSINLPWAIKN